MRRVLLVQPSLQPPGGGNNVAAWILQALVPLHNVTVLSWQPVAVDPINRFFGTYLRQSDFDTLVVPRSWKAIPDRLPVPAALLRSALLMRYARRFNDRFDVLLGVHNEMDFGRRGIQYIHYPTYFRPRPKADLRWYHQSQFILGAYYGVADRIADFSHARLRQNLTLANSNWTAARVKQFLGIDALTLYPPVADPAEGPPWHERRCGFLVVGRISPEKEFQRVIRILGRVHEVRPEVTLTIVGTWDRHVRRYYESLRQQAAALGPWIDFQTDRSRSELRTLMAANRYGIHGMREEHFGIAPAEMIRAGAIVWLPRGGGQVEIVGGEPALLYDTEDEAVERILRVMSDAQEEARLRTYLEARANAFSTDRFIEQIRTIVERFEP